nr:MAG TPA: hypothetical protein [Caudoviricetes sp.]
MIETSNLDTLTESNGLTEISDDITDAMKSELSNGKGDE